MFYPIYLDQIVNTSKKTVLLLVICEAFVGMYSKVYRYYCNKENYFSKKLRRWHWKLMEQLSYSHPKYLGFNEINQ